MTEAFDPATPNLIAADLHARVRETALALLSDVRAASRRR